MSEIRCRSLTYSLERPRTIGGVSVSVKDPLTLFDLWCGTIPRRNDSMYPDERLDHEIVLMVVATVCLLAIAGVGTEVQLAIVALLTPRLLKRKP